MSLSQQELIHYSRQVILPEIDEAGQERLKKSSILLAGLGGLGSSCALYLAAAGVGKIILADFDKVESSNLQRQIIHKQKFIGRTKVESATKTIKQLNPNVEIDVISEQLNEKNINDVKNIDVIIDATDNYRTRFMLNRFSVEKRIPLVHASAIKFKGHITTFNLNENSPCYECLFEDKDHNEETCEEHGVFPPIVGVMGSLQASEALKIIIGLASLDGLYQTIDLLNNKTNQFKLSKNPNCPTCSKH